MAMSKENSMLIDIQYIKPSRKTNNIDYLYVIWKDLRDGEKHLDIIPEPKVEIYFEKPEIRNHTYNKSYERIENLIKKTVKYKDIIFEIANDMGDIGRAKIQNCFATGNYQGLQEMYMYPYVYGADYDVRSLYRYKWLHQMENDKPKILTKGFMDIEVDSLEAPGMADPSYCPIDMVTVIDMNNKQSYTFALIDVGCKEKDMSKMSSEQKEKELKRREMYANRIKTQDYYFENKEELINEAHKMFDESYPGMKYNVYFYRDEKKMLVHLFQLINKLKLDFLGVWNISFDIPFIMERLKMFNLDPAEVICPKEFPIKQCYFKKDTINFQVKNKSDFFHVSSYTIYFDQMINYAAIRKGGQELRSNKLTYIANKELKDEKLDYSEDGDIKTLSYNNWLKYFLYNIKDVLLQYGIENKVSDVDTYYLTSYRNMTPYESEFKQTVKLRNVQYNSFAKQGLVPGENINKFIYNAQESEVTDDDDDEDDDKKTKFEGALVGDPNLIDKFGVELFGEKTNSIFKYSIDMDMSRFYPSCIAAMNIEPSCLIFKVIVDPTQYDVRNGDIPFHGITDVQINKRNSDSFDTDVAKEIFDNFQTRNYLSVGHKWLNLPSVNDVYERVKSELD